MKIGATIEGKKTELTKGGRQLLKLANNNIKQSKKSAKKYGQE